MTQTIYEHLKRANIWRPRASLPSNTSRILIILWQKTYPFTRHLRHAEDNAEPQQYCSRHCFSGGHEELKGRKKKEKEVSF